MNMKKTRSKSMLLCLLSILVFLLAACGSTNTDKLDTAINNVIDDAADVINSIDIDPEDIVIDNIEPVLTVSGVAATGAPITGNVYLKDITGIILGPQEIAADGSFHFDVTGLTPPYHLYSEDIQGNKLFSIAMGPGIANINPFTNLAIAIADCLTDPAEAYNNPAIYLKDITVINQAINDIMEILDPILDSFGAAGINPFTDPFIANHTGLDRVLDFLDIDVDTVNGVVTFTDYMENLLGKTTICDFSNAADTIEIVVTGSGITEPDPQGFIARLSFSTETGRLSYSFQRSHFVSTKITSITAVIGGVIVTGEGNINGTPGYVFTVRITDGSPDKFSIEIVDSDGSPYLSTDLLNVSVDTGFNVLIN